MVGMGQALTRLLCAGMGGHQLAIRRVDPHLAAATAHLQAGGVTMLSEEMDYISRRLRFFEGPEGITLELVEWVDVAPT